MVFKFIGHENFIFLSFFNSVFLQHGNLRSDLLEAAGVTIMVYSAAVQKKAVLQSFKQLFPQTPVAVGDDILMAFGESENCMLIHG